MAQQGVGEGELNHSTHASYLRRYTNVQVSRVVVGQQMSFFAVAQQLVMPGGITNDLATVVEMAA